MTFIQRKDQAKPTLPQSELAPMNVIAIFDVLLYNYEIFKTKTMINFDPIKNMELRLLVTASESINSQSTKEIQAMVHRIAALPLQGQLEIIDALRDEREKVRASKLARGLTPEMERDQLKKSAAILAAETRGFDMEVNKAREAAAKNNEGPPENILKTL